MNLTVQICVADCSVVAFFATTAPAPLLQNMQRLAQAATVKESLTAQTTGKTRPATHSISDDESAVGKLLTGRTPDAEYAI